MTSSIDKGSPDLAIGFPLESIELQVCFVSRNLSWTGEMVSKTVLRVGSIPCHPSSFLETTPRIADCYGKAPMLAFPNAVFDTRAEPELHVIYRRISEGRCDRGAGPSGSVATKIRR